MFKRYGAFSIAESIKEFADDNGWQDFEDKTDITTHFTRHYWTTHHRMRLPERIVKYIRGDTNSGEKVLEDYTHEEWVSIQKPYYDSIYQFGMPRLEYTSTPTDYTPTNR